MADPRFRAALLAAAGALPVLLAVVAVAVASEPLLGAALALALAYVPAAWTLGGGRASR